MNFGCQEFLAGYKLPEIPEKTGNTDMDSLSRRWRQHWHLPLRRKRTFRKLGYINVEADHRVWMISCNKYIPSPCGYWSQIDVLAYEAYVLARSNQ